MQSLITITFCERAENHVGMQVIGTAETVTTSPFTYDKLISLSKEIKNSELIDLSLGTDKACVLVVRNYVDEHEDLFESLSALEWDKKAFMRGRVVNKIARYNLCFADFEQEPDYGNKKGSVVNFSTLPRLQTLRAELEKLSGFGLVAEGNLYYNTSKCYIGYHGDAERHTVIGVRLGCTQNLKYQWYQNSQKIGDEYTITLHSGDVYIMSDKAVGSDWKKRKIATLRHGVNPHLSK